jgi:hypothetical protein
MESIFLIRSIPVPLRKKEIILLEDQFEELVYASGSLEKTRQLESAQFESYLTRDHARVPIVIKSDDQTIGVIVTLGERPSLSETRSAASFLRNHGSAKLLYLSAEPIEPGLLDERTMLCSIYAVI